MWKTLKFEDKNILKEPQELNLNLKIFREDGVWWGIFIMWFILKMIKSSDGKA